MTITLYHNPQCSKSRKALELLREAGAKIEVVRYLETPPTTAELSHILDRLGIEPIELVRRTEADFDDLGLGDPGVSRSELLAAMIGHPRLIQRPIAIRGPEARIGRPPERVLELL